MTQARRAYASTLAGLCAEPWQDGQSETSAYASAFLSPVAALRHLADTSAESANCSSFSGIFAIRRRYNACERQGRQTFRNPSDGPTGQLAGDTSSGPPSRTDGSGYDHTVGWRGPARGAMDGMRRAPNQPRYPTQRVPSGSASQVVFFDSSGGGAPSDELVCW